MRPAEFDYRAPQSLDEALEHLAAARGAARILAGGQSLMPQIIRREVSPEALVDLASVPELRGVEDRGAAIWIGAMESMVAIQRSAVLQVRLPLLVLAVGAVAHLPIRTRGTIGGSVANADPAAELPLVLSTLGARAELASSAGRRVVAVSELMSGPFATTLAANEVLVGFEIPVLLGRWAFHEESRRHNDRPLALAAAIEVDGRVRVGIGPTTQPGQVTTIDVPATGDVVDVAGQLVAQLDLFDEPLVPSRVRSAWVRASIERCLQDLLKG